MNILLRLANYISRYAPSEQKVLSYLEKKKVNEPKKILSEMGYSEEMMMNMWMRTSINTGKWEREIMQKLLLKWFPKEKIFEKIEEFRSEITDWHNIRSNLVRILQNKLDRGKSLTILRAEFLQKYPYCKEEILELLSDYDDLSGLKKEIEKYTRKYNLKIPSEKQKFYAAILRKWFRYDDVKKELERGDGDA